MMKNYYYLNGEIQLEDMDVIKRINQQEGVYEVIRVINHTPLFAREHVKRLYDSAKIMGIQITMDMEEMHLSICKLSKINNIKEQNIKLIITKNEALFYFIESFYPSEEMVREGIKTVYYHVSRDNPNVKVHNTKLRERINQHLKENKAYEAILVDKNGNIAEGSRSNVFFIKKGKLYTAPGDKVLMGITRTKVLKLCQELGIEVVEDIINVKDIKDIQGAFMTSTSNNILPIRSIEENWLDIENKMLNQLSKSFNELMNHDLKEMSNICKRILKEEK